VITGRITALKAAAFFYSFYSLIKLPVFILTLLVVGYNWIECCYSNWELVVASYCLFLGL